MIEAAIILALLALHVWTTREYAATLAAMTAAAREEDAAAAQSLGDALAAERARVSELLRLLEARAAPADFAAYVAPDASSTPNETWTFSDDGLVGLQLNEDR